MGITDMFSSKPQDPPIPPPSYPEMTGMYAAWEQEDMTGTVGVALDNSSLIIKIESFLSGKELVQKKDPKTGQTVTVWEQVAPPKMNEKGVRSVLLEIRAQLDKNAIMTYFPTYDDVIDFIRDFGIDLFLFLGRNSQDFELKDGDARQVGFFIIRQVHITLLRGLEGNEKQGVYKQLRRIENIATPLNSPQNMARMGGGMFK